MRARSFISSRLACLALLLLAAPAGAQRPPAPRLEIAVTDENGVAVAAARVTVAALPAGRTFSGETDFAGRLALAGVEPGRYRVTIAKPGFYSFAQELDLAPGAALDLSIGHQQPVGEVINVTDVVPGIDPQQTAKSETLNSRDIINIPYPTTRDVRNVLRYLPGVVETGQQVHIAGAASYQAQYVLDGFEIGQPSTGLLELRVSPDAVRTIEVESSRYSAQYGRGSGGVLVMDSRTGDDRFRFGVVNFIPTFQLVKGLHLNNWTPRTTLSGPLRRKRAWFYLSQDGETDHTVIKELPDTADSGNLWRVGTLAKVQANLSSANTLTTSFAYNYLDSPYTSLSAFTPREATPNQDRSAWMFTVKDQAYLSKSTLLELGLAAGEYRAEEHSHGLAPYEVHPDAVAGNYYRTQLTKDRRVQLLANLYLPPLQWLGRHEIRVGADFTDLRHREQAHRGPTLVFREDGTLARRITFVDPTPFERSNLESSAYLQDRWSPASRLIIEAGLRLDSDQVVRDLLLSPRFSGTYLLTRHGETKLTGGAGFFHDATRLDFIVRPQQGERVDEFYDATGRFLALPPALTRFQVNDATLHAPRFLNWSLGVERRLPGQVHTKFEFLEKAGRDGFNFTNPAADAGAPGGTFLLSNARRDRYDAFQVIARRDFRNNHALLAAYTRSAARTNRVLEFTLDNPIFGPQGRGPLPWDTPNRIVSWGWLPLPHFPKFDFAYSLEFHDGFAYSVVNQNQQLVGAPDTWRFPAYFSFNPAVERRFFFFGYEWALRAGIENITGRLNPQFVNNNIDSAQFGQFSGTAHRTFNGRIRFLGKK